MDKENIKDILQTILKKIQDKELIWRLEGSVNLKVQGVEILAKDLDITTNDEGIEIFRNALNKYVVKDFFSQKINGRSIVCNINDFEVEVNSYGDRELDMFDKTKRISWNGLEIPILPLEYAKKFYELIDRKEKVDLISNYFSD